MLISETIKKLEELKEIYGDIPLIKWDVDSGLSEITNDSFIVIANDNFETTRYAERIAIK